MQATPSLTEKPRLYKLVLFNAGEKPESQISRLFKLIIFDIDGTLTVPHTAKLLPGRREFFIALAEEHARGQAPSITLATNQGDVGFRHWLKTTQPPWFTEKSEAEQEAQIAIYPTQAEAEAQLNEVATAIAKASNIWPETYISFAWQFKSGSWADIPPGAEKDIRWSQEWRKPNPGMLEKAIVDHGVLPHQTLMVGDKITDIQAGQAARCGTTAWAKDFFEEVSE